MKIFKKLSTASILWLGLIIAGGAAFTPAAMAGTDPIYTSFLSNVAVQGHDVVAYFKQGKPVKGSDKFSTEYQGADFHFSSAENLAAFKNDPKAYAPQYGGYCAWAVAEGYTAKGDANYWAIVDKKLYLNYNADVKATWSTDIPGFIKKADENWPKLLNP
ncbi:MAG: YHS domain-containing protein [Methylocystaceae bacterium]|nr:YHS domain-containing protein [Methylocystaceae bacterium]